MTTPKEPPHSMANLYNQATYLAELIAARLTGKA